MSANPTPALASFRLAVDLRQLPWVRPLVSDYVFAHDRLATFFSGDPQSPEAWDSALERDRRKGQRRDDIVALVHGQQRLRGAPPEAVAAAARLSDPRSAVVVTGQQAGLFGGPLFTLLKAVTALQLARRESLRQGVPVEAVFWIDAEDHDWAEVQTCAVLDADFHVRRTALPEHHLGDVPVARVPVEASIDGAIHELQAALPPTEFTGDIIEALRAAYVPGRGMADAFGRWLEYVLGRHGLIVFDGSDTAAKTLVRELFAQELTTDGASDLAAAAGAELIASGYHAQVVPHPESTALFDIRGVRQPIRRSGGYVSMGDVTIEATTAGAEALAHPEHFSPNVLLRPVVQDTLFPTICYVAGPNELAYLGQLRRIYERFGVPMPLMYPRATATLIDSATARFLTKHELPLEALQPQDEAALNRLLASSLPAGVDQALDAAGKAIAERMDVLAAAVPALDATLAGAVKGVQGKMEHDLSGLRGKIIQAAKRRDDTLRRQFLRARALTFPDGHPQERVVGFVYFLNRYGPALVDRLLESLPVDMGAHWVLAI